MIEKFRQLADAHTNNYDNVDIMVTLHFLSELVAIKKIIVEDYPIDDFGANSYLPFMNYLQHRDYESVRRFILIHPKAVSGGQWDTAGNGVCPH